MKKIQIVEKAYQIDLSRIYDNYGLSKMMCYAENRNKAKVELLKEYLYDDLKVIVYYRREPLSYLNIPVIRKKDADKVLFEDKEMLRSEMTKLIEERKRNATFDKILHDDSVTHCYIVKRFEYYGPNYRGYVLSKEGAGVYPKEDAVLEARGCEEITLECIQR